MKITFAICALFALLVLTNAETLTKARLRAMSPIERDIRSETAFLALRDTPFGKNLFAMMNLKFKSTGQLDNILSLLHDLEANIRQQQKDDDDLFDTTSKNYQNTIDESKETIKNAISEIETKTGIKDQKTIELGNAKTTRDNLIQEDKDIRKFLEDLKTTRENEAASYATRLADQTAMLEGLDEVILLFKSEVEHSSNIDAGEAQNILDLLTQIRNSLQASIDEDSAAETAAIIKYDEFVKNRNARLKEIEGELATVIGQITQLEKEIGDLEREISAAEDRKKDAQKLLDDTEAALKKLTDDYHANSAIRTDQLTLLKQVEDRLTKNPENVQQFIDAAL